MRAAVCSYLLPPPHASAPYLPHVPYSSRLRRRNTPRCHFVIVATAAQHLRLLRPLIAPPLPHLLPLHLRLPSCRRKWQRAPSSCTPAGPRTCASTSTTAPAAAGGSSRSARRATLSPSRWRGTAHVGILQATVNDAPGRKPFALGAMVTVRRRALGRRAQQHRRYSCAPPWRVRRFRCFPFDDRALSAHPSPRTASPFHPSRRLAPRWGLRGVLTCLLVHPDAQP